MYTNEVKILGIDPGSQICGYAFIATKNPHAISKKSIQFIDIGILKADKSLSFLDRIAAMHETMHTLVKEHQPNICVVENAFVGQNVQSALKLGQARGSLMAAVSRCQVKMEEVTPTFVKKTIAGNGCADKEQISIALKNLVGFERGALPYDASDALAVALSYCFSGGVSMFLEKNRKCFSSEYL